MTEIRGRIFMVLVYPDDERYILFCENLEKYVFWAKINHDMDEIDDTGEIKKIHTHYVLYFPNKKVLSSISTETGVPENYIEIWDSKSKALKYLVHKNHPNKYQYDYRLVDGTLAPDLERLLNDGYEVSVVRCIFEKIDEGISWRDLCKWSLENGYYAEFRRSQMIIREYFKLK